MSLLELKHFTAHLEIENVRIFACQTGRLPCSFKSVQGRPYLGTLRPSMPHLRCTWLPSMQGSCLPLWRAGSSPWLAAWLVHSMLGEWAARRPGGGCWWTQKLTKETEYGGSFAQADVTSRKWGKTSPEAGVIGELLLAGRWERRTRAWLG